MEAYELLFVSPGAPEKVVRAAYKARAMEAHPDAGGTTEAFQEIEAAFSVIETEGFPSRAEIGQPQSEGGDSSGAFTKKCGACGISNRVGRGVTEVRCGACGERIFWGQRLRNEVIQLWGRLEQAMGGRFDFDRVPSSARVRRQDLHQARRIRNDLAHGVRRSDSEVQEAYEVLHRVVLSLGLTGEAEAEAWARQDAAARDAEVRARRAAAKRPPSGEVDRSSRGSNQYRHRNTERPQRDVAADPPADDGNEWIAAGFSPGVARPWVQAGFSLEEALQWGHREFNALDAAGWRELGLLPDGALPWRQAGLSAGEARPWVRAAFAPDEAIRWRQRGFEASAAAAWKNEGLLPDGAQAWAREGFQPDEVARWGERGFTPSEAALWVSRGKTPVEAQQARAGRAGEERQRAGASGTSDGYEARAFPCAFCGLRFLSESSRTLHHQQAHRKPDVRGLTPTGTVPGLGLDRETSSSRAPESMLDGGVDLAKGVVNYFIQIAGCFLWVMFALAVLCILFVILVVLASAL